MMPTTEQEIAAVREAIVQAFPTAPVPVAAQLTELVHPLEAADIRAAFGGRRWTEVPAYHVARSADALSWFTPTAFQYYLPAYLTWRLADPERGRSSNVSEALVRSLLPLVRAVRSDRPGQPAGTAARLAQEATAVWRQRRAGLTPEQQTVVARWFQLLYWHLEPHWRRDREAMRHYQKYWKPLLPPAPP